MSTFWKKNAITIEPPQDSPNTKNIDSRVNKTSWKIGFKKGIFGISDTIFRAGNKSGGIFLEKNCAKIYIGV